MATLESTQQAVLETITLMTEVAHGDKVTITHAEALARAIRDLSEAHAWLSAPSNSH